MAVRHDARFGAQGFVFTHALARSWHLAAREKSTARIDIPRKSVFLPPTNGNGFLPSEQSENRAVLSRADDSYFNKIKVESCPHHNAAHISNNCASVQSALKAYFFWRCTRDRLPSENP
jgi:hypothetical protein